MQPDRSVMLWKLFALAATGIYIYKAIKANGGNLSGNPYGIKLNANKLVDNVVPLLNLNREEQEKAREYGLKIADKIINGRES